jgi:RNA polymerase sigma-70 factor (ECF subfamily)
VGASPSGPEAWSHDDPPSPHAYRAASDEQLVDLVRAGDDRAFDAIHARYEQRLIGYARPDARRRAPRRRGDRAGRLRARAAALRADRREMALKPWLFTIVRNRTLDVLRRPARTTDLEVHAPMLRDAGADPHEQVMRADDLRDLVGELQRLPERQRIALVAHELGGDSHETIARRLNVSVGGSKALVCRARSGLGRAKVAA